MPREFNLILPSDLSAGARAIVRGQAPGARHIQTSVLPTVLSQLEIALKRSARIGRDRQQRFRAPLPPSTPFNTPAALGDVTSQRPAPNAPSTSSRPPFVSDSQARQHRNPKTKIQRPLVRASIGASPRMEARFDNGQQAWWLDVASPTWEDMRALGTVSESILAPDTIDSDGLSSYSTSTL